jgi:hypothetical protein
MNGLHGVISQKIELHNNAPQHSNKTPTEDAKEREREREEDSLQTVATGRSGGRRAYGS